MDTETSIVVVQAFAQKPSGKVKAEYLLSKEAVEKGHKGAEQRVQILSHEAFGGNGAREGRQNKEKDHVE